MLFTQTNPPHEQWLEPAGGPRIFTRHWRPSGGTVPRAAMVICHGVNSHGGQYLRAGEEFAAAGFAVTALDLRGPAVSPEAQHATASWSGDLADLASARELAAVGFAADVVAAADVDADDVVPLLTDDGFVAG